MSTEHHSKVGLYRGLNTLLALVVAIGSGYTIFSRLGTFLQVLAGIAAGAVVFFVIEIILSATVKGYRESYISDEAIQKAKAEGEAIKAARQAKKNAGK